MAGLTVAFVCSLEESEPAQLLLSSASPRSQMTAIALHLSKTSASYFRPGEEATQLIPALASSVTGSVGDFDSSFPL